MDIIVNVKHRKLKSMYLEWFNNFLSVDRFAEYYGITQSSARRIINHFNKMPVYGDN